MAGITVWNFYFRFFNGSIRSPQVIEFLKHLLRHIPGKIWVIWDGAGIHRSGLVRDFVDSLKGRIRIERLPAYAPELNPSEYIFGHLKHHELANFCAQNAWNLSLQATKALRRMRRRPRLIQAFWKQAELW